MSAQVSAAHTAGKPHNAQRLTFIDIMRGLACVWMIETHVINACLSWQYRGGWLFNVLNTTNGYVSVSFIFCAGAGFWLAATRKAQEYKTFQPSLWHYVRRLGFILLVAYWLHIPEISLRKYLIAAPERQNILWICDVLHAIAIASFIALALLMLVPTLKQLRWVFVGFAVLFVFGAPLVWQLEPDTFLPRALGSYLSRPPAAAFPLFPWCGYFFIGAALTAFFLESKDRRTFAKRTAWVGFITPFVVMTFFWTGWNQMFNYGWTENWYLCSPGNVIFRVSGSALLFSLLFLWQDRLAGWSVFRRKPAQVAATDGTGISICLCVPFDDSLWFAGKPRNVVLRGWCAASLRSICADLCCHCGGVCAHGAVAFGKEKFARRAQAHHLGIRPTLCVDFHFCNAAVC